MAGVNEILTCDSPVRGRPFEEYHRCLDHPERSCLPARNGGNTRQYGVTGTRQDVGTRESAEERREIEAER